MLADALAALKQADDLIRDEIVAGRDEDLDYEREAARQVAVAQVYATLLVAEQIVQLETSILNKR